MCKFLVSSHSAMYKSNICFTIVIINEIFETAEDISVKLTFKNLLKTNEPTEFRGSKKVSPKYLEKHRKPKLGDVYCIRICQFFAGGN